MDTSWTKGLSPRSEAESEMLKMALNAISESPDATLGSGEFLDFVKNLKEKSMKVPKKDDAQKLLVSLINRQWLEWADEVRYTRNLCNDYSCCPRSILFLCIATIPHLRAIYQVYPCLNLIERQIVSRVFMGFLKT